MLSNYILIFSISLFTIALEFFLTRILSLKTWNHLVYLIIPFAMLGYGIGANIFLIFKKKVSSFKSEHVLSFCLFSTAFLSIINTWILAGLNIEIDMLLQVFKGASPILNLLAAYTLVFFPFIPIGFLVVYLFSSHVSKSDKLYFFDLLGAGLGAVLFVYLIYRLAIFRSIVLLAAPLLALGLYLLFRKNKLAISLIAFIIVLSWLPFLKEPAYVIDKAKGWERFEGVFKKHQYERVVSKWHPLGRTDIFRIIDPQVKNKMLENAFFKINASPAPAISYIATNATAGTPIFNLSDEGLKGAGSKIQLFSQVFEVPYILGDKKGVVVIGTGGGRDLFIAKTHGATRIVGAEINPATHAQMSPGGTFYEYSGGLYNEPPVEVFKMDGRHLVKKLKPQKFDLIVLTGVDTFSGLNNGAYTYAESYLYTKNAIIDYMNILQKDGILNFNRRYFEDQPREGLRLFTLSLSALEEMGKARPWENIVIGAFQQWAILLVKNEPYQPQEIAALENYLKKHSAQVLFSPTSMQNKKASDMNVFEGYAKAFMDKTEKDFEKAYPYDISVVTDNDPFFYKYYKFKLFNPFFVEYDRHTGTLIFITQIAVLIQAIAFILLFIFTPLIKFKFSGIKNLPKKSIAPFILYFSCLGLGFMLLEIPLMQKFVLLLGSPIYSIAVTLSALLVFSGLGSYVCKHFHKKGWFPGKIAGILSLLLILFIVFGIRFFDHFIQYAFFVRVIIICASLFPLGLCLGMFFPSGLELVGEKHEEAVAWAWGLNSGFSVLGSILAIFLAQFWGFNNVLLIALAIYVTAGFSYVRLKQGLQ